MFFDMLLAELFPAFPDTRKLVQALVRLSAAVLIGGIIGLEREYENKRAGIRTHMLVALGSAMFPLVALQGGMTIVDLSRVIQGVVVGVGFLGAGTILKISTEQEIRGLTTAASIWVTAAAGLAAGMGSFWPSITGMAFAWFILFFVRKLERRFKARRIKEERGRTKEER